MTKHNLVATYASPEQARAALQALERKGVDAGDIEVFGPGVDRGQPVTNDEQHDMDMAAMSAVGKRFAEASIALAVVGLVLGAALGGLVAGDGTGVLVGAVGGVIVGGLLGFLWGGYATLTVNEQFEDTFQAQGGETSVAVHADDEHVIDLAREALAGSDPRKVEVV